MAKKVKVKNLKEVFLGVQALYFDDTAKRQIFLNEQAKFLRDRIVAETRKGKDLSRKGVSQPPLSQGYINWRRKLKDGKAPNRENIKPHPIFFSPSFSNLTLTGQLLDSVQWFVNERRKFFEIRPTGVRRNPKNSFIKNLFFGLRNQTVANDLARRGRTFLGIDEKGLKRVRKAFIDEFRRELKNNNFT
jgi:hypothetical protein